MKLYIITDGGKEIGLGHITRCLSFYDNSPEIFEVQMLVDCDESCNNIIGNRKFQRLHWHNNINLLDIVENNIVIMDSLIASQTQTDYIAKIAKLFIVIDDYKRRQYKNTVIIDWTPNVENNSKHKHNHNNKNTLLLGLEYCVLRKPFTNNKQETRTSNTLSQITVIMGGTDAKNLTPTIAKKINDVFPEILVNVITANTNNKEKVIAHNIKYFHSLDANEIKTIFKNSDLVISAAGQTLFELAALNTPTIPIQVADNQSEDIEGLQNLHFFDTVLQWDDNEILGKITTKIKSLYSIEDRTKYLSNWKNRNIGNGINAIMDAIKENLNDKIC